MRAEVRRWRAAFGPGLGVVVDWHAVAFRRSDDVVKTLLPSARQTRLLLGERRVVVAARRRQGHGVHSPAPWQARSGAAVDRLGNGVTEGTSYQGVEAGRARGSAVAPWLRLCCGKMWRGEAERRKKVCGRWVEDWARSYKRSTFIGGPLVR